jgi:hypothetical protein
LAGNVLGKLEGEPLLTSPFEQRVLEGTQSDEASIQRESALLQQALIV